MRYDAPFRIASVEVITIGSFSSNEVFTAASSARFPGGVLYTRTNRRKDS
jgi:hypothetical protein